MSVCPLLILTCLRIVWARMKEEDIESVSPIIVRMHAHICRSALEMPVGRTVDRLRLNCPCVYVFWMLAEFVFLHCWIEHRRKSKERGLKKEVEKKSFTLRQKSKRIENTNAHHETDDVD